MNYWFSLKIKQKIFLYKLLLNSLLRFLSPRNKFIIKLSQNLDNHIVAYHKHLI